MRMEEHARASLLLDFYGPLLTSHRARVMSLWCEEDLSLSEIAEEMGVSRQAVHEAIREGQRQLSEYEEKLGMAARYQRILEAVDECRRALATTDDAPTRRLTECLNQIEGIVR